MAGGSGDASSFESTPSWIIGAVVFAIVGISWALENLLEHLGEVLKKKDRKPLYEALQKIKDELMLMGFVSLLLTVSQDKITWCISEKLAKKWLPCHYEGQNATSTIDNTTAHFQVSQIANRRRRLLAAESSISCAEGKVPFVSTAVLHDIHYLIFVLAVVHVVSCTAIVLLGEAKIFQWRKWEEYIRSQSVLGDDRKEKIIDIRSLTFIRHRFEGVDGQKRSYFFSFFKHLGGIVTKADYSALRLGFVLAHCNGNQRFNFHKYMVYAYEADFQKVVSISWYLWLLAVGILSLDVAGWNIHFWISFIPLFLLLIVGTKLQQVITELATYVAQRHSVIVGEIRIQPSDEYFWFNRPKIFLFIIQTILFLNSFGLAIFFWTLIKFKFNSCIMGEPAYAITRIAIMVFVQTICSYSTLPLYAIVTQMGTFYNREAMLRYSHECTRDLYDRVPATNGAAVVQMGNQ